MDADGYVNIVGRIKEHGHARGENIYPREVEEFLYTKAGGRGRAGHWRADAKYGEELMAWVNCGRAPA